MILLSDIVNPKISAIDIEQCVGDETLTHISSTRQIFKQINLCQGQCIHVVTVINQTLHLVVMVNPYLICFTKRQGHVLQVVFTSFCQCDTTHE